MNGLRRCWRYLNLVGTMSSMSIYAVRHAKLCAHVENNFSLSSRFPGERFPERRAALSRFLLIECAHHILFGAVDAHFTRPRGRPRQASVPTSAGMAVRIAVRTFPEQCCVYPIKKIRDIRNIFGQISPSVFSSADIQDESSHEVGGCGGVRLSSMKLATTGSLRTQQVRG